MTTLTKKQIASLKAGVNAILAQRQKYAFDSNVFKAGGNNTPYGERAAREYNTLTTAVETINQIITESAAIKEYRVEMKNQLTGEYKTVIVQTNDPVIAVDTAERVNPDYISLVSKGIENE